MAVNITWLGHSTFKIETPEGKVILIDPWLEQNPACPEAARNLDCVDILLCTHGHYDHIGDAAGVIERFQPKVVAVFELSHWLEKLGARNPRPMNLGGSIALDGVNIAMVKAEHSNSYQTPDGELVYGGPACGFVLEFSDGLVIYHAGDTAVFGDMETIADLYEPDVALLPIGGLFTMGPAEAAYACDLLRPRLVIPMHFGTFPALTGSPKELEDASDELDFDLLVLKPGETEPIDVDDFAEEGGE